MRVQKVSKTLVILQILKSFGSYLWTWGETICHNIQIWWTVPCARVRARIKEVPCYLPTVGWELRHSFIYHKHAGDQFPFLFWPFVFFVVVVFHNIIRALYIWALQLSLHVNICITYQKLYSIHWWIIFFLTFCCCWVINNYKWKNEW